MTDPFELVKNGNVSELRQMIENGLYVDMTGEEGFTLINVAIENSNEEIVKLLIQNGASLDPSEDIEAPIGFAICEENIKMIELLISYETNLVRPIGPNRECLLNWAIENCCKNEVIETLIEKGVNVNEINDEEYFSPLYNACKKEEIRLVKLLIDNGAKLLDSLVKNETGHILYYLSKDNCVDIIELLIENVIVEFHKSYEYEEIFRIACMCDSTEIVKLLLEHRAEVNVKFHGYDKMTPLHYASKNDSHEVVKFLIQSCADVNIGDEYGNTPLYYACERRNIEIVNILLDNGADVNIGDIIGWTPLHCACERGNVEIVKLLLEHNADVNCKDKAGNTSLRLASRYGHTDIIKLLRKFHFTQTGNDELVEDYINSFYNSI